ncbi:MAG: NPCBM/NEW2 domain-containing protein, partial [Phycisphaerae bacterium]|nr:NPCBM/NEW2 domain-containing protein [Phycisphaerae bacterium]
MIVFLFQLAAGVATMPACLMETSTMADVRFEGQPNDGGVVESTTLAAWADTAFGSTRAAEKRGPVQLELRRQDHAAPGWGMSCIGTPIRLGELSFQHGLGTHANSEIVVQPPPAATEFSAVVGIDNNHYTQAARGSAAFTITLDGVVAFESPALRGDSTPLPIKLALPAGTREIVLSVDIAGDGAGWDHADWADAHFVLADGTRLYLDENQVSPLPSSIRPPFSFRIGESSGEAWMRRCSLTSAEDQTDAATVRQYAWTDTETGLRVTATVKTFKHYPAVDWVLWFENAGSADTPIIADVRALDAILRSPLGQSGPYRLHRTLGAPSNPRDFEPATAPIAHDASQTLGAAGGRSSNGDFPFFTVETGGGTWVVAVGWSGQWDAVLRCPDQLSLRIDAGQATTNFRLRPGERVRSPRMLLFHGPSDAADAQALFRQLIYAEYAAKRGDQIPEPILFCNTCFTRGGGWLNECNAENQISLIKAYAPLGLEALITDAGWSEGGWPAGAGNWNLRKDAYPDGIGPVATAAQAHNMAYGLWFEPERVVAGSALHRDHPEWLLSAGAGEQETYLANFALPEVREYFFEIVKEFMDLPGFQVYRQDFNMDPLPYWQYSDAPDRQGISEAKYVEGLYEFWDRLAET